MPMGYVAYEIDEASREKLLKIFAPKYPETIAHHITHKYGAAEDEVPEMPKIVKVMGYHDSGAIQVLAVQIDGHKHQITCEEGGEKFYHITFSIDRAQGVSARNSNDVLQGVVKEQGEAGLYNLKEPIEITATPKFFVDEDAPQRKQAKPPASPVS